MKPRFGRKWRAAGALGLLLGLTVGTAGCSFDIGGMVEDKVNEFAAEQGLDADITLTTGESCLPDWVNHPEEESTNQGWNMSEAEVCVSSWPEIAADVDVGQQLPAALDDSDIASIAQMLIPLMMQENPGGLGALLGGEAQGHMDDLGQQFAEQGVDFTAYGDNDRLLLVLSGTGDSEPGKMSLSMGVFCNVTC